MELTNINDVKKLLGTHGFRFSKSMGQNFLIKREIPIMIAEGSGADETCGVLEIGPGIGALTTRLAERAGKVVAVELDRELLPVLKITLADHDNIEVISGDILKDGVLDEATEKLRPLTPIVCANLPYNITTPVITALLESGVFRRVTVMVQREVAHRICAKPGTADYGAFTVFCNYYTKPTLLFDVAPDSFIPAPKVYSSVVRMDVLDKPPTDLVGEEAFFRTVRAAFSQRRKTLANSLSSSFTMIPKARVTEIITLLGFDEKIRGETLDIPAFARLARAIEEELNHKEN
ncbi:MAG: 16S rRNA (adenine(1518)-N(6)/adenine(1519)-N(6))-dimethyltransferase RsmA [Oscillospiraceae bacterium]|nr:16S rRNA (adenine(1518)-N(6)/adenine(1519)-N(6))-dimethyltransferase RsmA [Oscillospiraceae bacterium]